MDVGTLVAVGTGLAGAIGGWLGGRQTVAVQSAALDALELRIEDQQRTISTIPDMQAKIAVLEELVTQRANVSRVIEVVERIEVKIDGLAHNANAHDGRQ